MNTELTMEEAFELEDNREFSIDEFIEIVVKPIRAAYIRPDFLKEEYERDIWFGELRYHGYGRVKTSVNNWIRSKSKIPVLSDILHGVWN